jgi:hypothetical protein
LHFKSNSFLMIANYQQITFGIQFRMSDCPALFGICNPEIVSKGSMIRELMITNHPQIAFGIQFRMSRF